MCVITFICAAQNIVGRAMTIYMDTMYFLQLVASTATQDRTHTVHSLLAKYNCKCLVHWQQLHTIIIGMWAGANEDQYILPGKYIIYI